MAYAYVSTAFNKMDNSKEGQEQSLARAKKQTGYLEDSAAQASGATYHEDLRGFA